MNYRNLLKPYVLLIGVLTLGLSLYLFSQTPETVLADDTAGPTSVTIAGSLQSELGCPGDWQPECANTHLGYDANDDVWQGVFTVPAGNWEYKAALNNSWDENYGANAVPNGGNIFLNLGAETSVKFYYDHKSHWVTDNQNSFIATVPGSFQSELGCSGNWDPGCLRSWLQDPDGDGTYSFTTTASTPGNYEAKVTINESWDENYGVGGVQNGPNIPFSVAIPNSEVTFSYDPISHILTITVTSPGHAQDNNVEWDGVRHDSRDMLYRTPGGAVPAGTPVTLRLRTFHNDVTEVSVRVYSLNASGQSFANMTLAASDVSCYQDDLAADSCDFWEVPLPNAAADNLWYRFIVTDGTDTDYYADNTPALDGGLGSTSDDVVDNSFALTVYDPAFIAPDWASNAVIYQIFPDRFRDGRMNNNPITGDVRYDDPVLALPWGTLPEGYCRNYADGNTNCPWRFDDTPPDWSPTKEGPRGRDYMGGDLKGVDQYLEYLQSLGVNTIYFNPIFDAGSNHSYDTQDYYKIDPYFGTQKDWKNLVKHANQRGIRIVLDGVFNHLSSDSPFFDRYHHYDTLGACESFDSPYREWFYFHDVAPGTGTCVDGNGTPNAANYDGWFGFDSIPVINKSLTAVQEYFLAGDNSVSRYWLNQGASGWRMDVMGDASFPAGYWETFRGVVKDTQSDALIISETWQKDSTLLRMLRGDRADTTMNYRLRDAVIGLLAPGNFDSKGFADSGRQISPSEFASRLESIQEDYPQQAFYSLMNLLDSHDTERLLWTLTPGEETTAGKELNAANLADGKQRQMIASLIQFTLPGAPTVFYGDEVGMTGDDDPDDRRTYPWGDLGGNPDLAMFDHYQTLAALRQQYPALVDGNFQILLADDASEVVAYGRKTGSQAAVVIVNRGDTEQSGAISVAGFLPDGVTLQSAYVVGSGGPASVTVSNGELNGTVGPRSALLLVTGLIDLTPPNAPSNLMVTNEGDAQVSLSWNSVPGAAGYTLYRSPLSGGGWVEMGSGLTGTSFTDTGLVNGKNYYYVVTASDGVGNESGYSNEVSALPHYTIGWANLQWPPTMNHTISVVNRTETAYGQVWIDGVTNQPGPTPGLIAQLGFGPEGSDPDGNSNWTWETASFNVDAGNNDEFKASLLPETTGSFDYVYRYSTTNGRDWLYADLNGPILAGSLPPNPGKLTVNSSDDLIPPPAPTGLLVASASPVAISLAWNAHPNSDGDLAGFDVYRDGALLARLVNSSATGYTDTSVVENTTYDYYIVAFDTSFNRSAASNPVTATATPRTVTVIFNVTVPTWTPASQSVHIAGTLSRLDGGFPDWNSAAVSLSPAGENQWTIFFTGLEGTQIEYKYTLGTPDFFDVEKGGSCNEINNRQLTLNYGSTGIQNVNDTVLNWRNVSPCGN
ncbi:MAG TPA: alpha-amylase family glycosyl hydrolase [Anaerolineales bacterium]|nr:alpha-amylase family glycosyl hydrolase [Anaerolineales bacterium]